MLNKEVTNHYFLNGEFLPRMGRTQKKIVITNNLENNFQYKNVDFS